MKKFLNLLKKDTRELVTIQVLIPVILMVVLYSLIGRIAGSEIQKSTSPKGQQVVVLNLDNSNTSNSLESTFKSANITPLIPDEPTIEASEKLARSKNVNVIIEIPQNFGNDVMDFKQPQIKVYTIMKDLSIPGIIQSSSVNQVLAVINNSISSEFLSKNITGIPPDVIKNPIKTQDFVMVNDNTAQISPSTISGAMTSQTIFIPLIIMFVVIFSSQMLAASIASEKQNKTLETLLTVPVNRNLIILSKMLGAGFVAMIISAVYMIGMRNYIQGISGGAATSSATTSAVLKQLGLTLSPSSFILLGLSIFFAILAALSISAILGAYSEDEKSAQMMLTPMMILLLIPYFLTIFTNPSTFSLPLKIILYAIPFSHTFLAYGNLMFGNIPPVIFGLLYEIGFSAVCILIAARIFSSDRLLTAKLRLKKGFKR
jgi:ABC-2 type transport system permease protein